MKTTLFSIKSLSEMLLDNDCYLSRTCPPIFVPSTMNATYSLLYADGLVNAIAKKEEQELSALFQNATKLLTNAPLHEVMDFVSRNHLKNADTILQSWQDYKSFVTHLKDTYEDTVREICDNTNSNTDINQDMAFGECLWNFYQLLMDCLRMELPPLPELEEIVDKRLSELAGYLFDELIPKCRYGFSTINAPQIHRCMLLRFSELNDIATNMYLT